MSTAKIAIDLGVLGERAAVVEYDYTPRIAPSASLCCPGSDEDVDVYSIHVTLGGSRMDVLKMLEDEDWLRELLIEKHREMLAHAKARDEEAREDYAERVNENFRGYA